MILITRRMMVAKLVEPVLLIGVHRDDKARRSLLLLTSAIILVIFIMTSTSSFLEVGPLRRLTLLLYLDPAPASSGKNLQRLFHMSEVQPDHAYA